MSVAFRFKSELPSLFPKTATEVAPISYRPRIAEAPDRGISGEAPETRSAEAPDAGEGRMNHMENEYTHGRSQS